MFVTWLCHNQLEQNRETWSWCLLTWLYHKQMEQNKIKLMLKTWLSHKELEQDQETLRFIYLALSQATGSKIKKHWYLSTWLCHNNWSRTKKNLKQMFWVHGSVGMCMNYTWIQDTCWHNIRFRTDKNLHIQDTATQNFSRWLNSLLIWSALYLSM